MPKSPRVAAVMSAFPGLGNVYNSLYLRGITFFVLFWALIQMADRGLLDEPRPATGGDGALLAGAAIFLLGLVAFLDIQLGLDIDWILDFWPIGLMTLGGWFIWSGSGPERHPPRPLRMSCSAPTRSDALCGRRQIARPKTGTATR